MYSERTCTEVLSEFNKESCYANANKTKHRFLSWSVG
jgi:hypothetical protein